MKPVVKKATPAALAVLKQATVLRPKRKKASDGLLPSAAHLKASPDSDHNSGLAVDITHDPINGIDCHDAFVNFKSDRRVVYLIFNGKIWSKERSSEGDRQYTGSNKHSSHLHISIDPKHCKDTSPWFTWMNRAVYTTADAARVAAAYVKPKPKKK